MMKTAFLVLLPDTLMETLSLESRRCLRRIFFLAHHSRKATAPSVTIAWSGTRLNRRSPLPRMERAVHYDLKTTNHKDRNDTMKTLNIPQNSLLTIRRPRFTLILVALTLGLFVLASVSTA